MNKSALTKKIKSIYSTVFPIQQRYYDSFHSAGTRQLDNVTKQYNEILNDKNASQDLKDQIAILLNGHELVQKNLKAAYEANKATHQDVDVAVDNAVNEYQRAVSVYTQNGGKGFYDVVTTISNQRDGFRSCLPDVMAVITRMQSNGHDIVEIYRDNEDISSDSANRFTIMMPSSSYAAFQDELEAENEYFVETSFTHSPLLVSFDTSFILPHAVEHGITIEDVKKYCADYNASYRDVESAATSLGYLRAELPCQGFRTNQWDHLKDAIKLSVSEMMNYRKPGYHCNGLMPTPYLIGDKSKETLNIPKEVDVRVNVLNDIELEKLRMEKDSSLER